MILENKHDFKVSTPEFTKGIWWEESISDHFKKMNKFPARINVSTIDNLKTSKFLGKKRFQRLKRMVEVKF